MKRAAQVVGCVLLTLVLTFLLSWCTLKATDGDVHCPTGGCSQR